MNSQLLRMLPQPLLLSHSECWLRLKNLPSHQKNQNNSMLYFSPSQARNKIRLFFPLQSKLFFCPWYQNCFGVVRLLAKKKKTDIVGVSVTAFSVSYKTCFPPLTVVILFGKALLDTLALQPPMGDQDEHCLLASTQQ